LEPCLKVISGTLGNCRVTKAATSRRFGTLFEGDLRNIGELSCYQSGGLSPLSRSALRS
jgi:hypothetical protein